jgi:hypothetical protein
MVGERLAGRRGALVVGSHYSPYVSLVPVEVWQATLPSIFPTFSPLNFYVVVCSCFIIVYSLVFFKIFR